MSARMNAPAAIAPARPVTFKAAIPGALALGLVVAVVSGARLPVIASDRDFFFALLALGWLGCMAGAGPTIQALGWRHPICLAGMALGVIALALVALVVTGAAAGAHADRVAFIGLAAVLGAKWVLGITTAALPSSRH